VGAKTHHRERFWVEQRFSAALGPLNPALAAEVVSGEHDRRKIFPIRSLKPALKASTQRSAEALLHPKSMQSEP